MRDKGGGFNGKVPIDRTREDEHIEPKKAAKGDEYKIRRALNGACTKGDAHEG